MHDFTGSIDVDFVNGEEVRDLPKEAYTVESYGLVITLPHRRESGVYPWHTIDFIKESW